MYVLHENKSEFDLFLDYIVDNIIEKRKSLNIKQYELGYMIGKPQSTIARFESRKNGDFQMSLLFDICIGLSINPGDVIGDAFLKSSHIKRRPKKQSKYTIDDICDALENFKKMST